MHDIIIDKNFIKRYPMFYSYYETLVKTDPVSASIFDEIFKLNKQKLKSDDVTSQIQDLKAKVQKDVVNITL